MGALSFSSCGDECDDVDCRNGATCDEGDCICTTGFEGTECETETRAKFFGTYNVSESCTSGNFTYQLTITTSGTNAVTIILNNFYGVNASVSATVSGNSITIPNQTLSVQGTSVTFGGTGQLTGNILTISFTASGDETDTCTATCTRI